MTYTGEVRPGGPADVRELPDAVIRKASVSSMDNNVYLLTDRATGEQLLVDAADGAESLIQLADGALATIVTTHQHWDHHRALREVVDATGARTAAGAEDADALPVPPDDLLRQGDQVRFGEVVLDVVRTPKHCLGVYAEVQVPGRVAAGDPVELVD